MSLADRRLPWFPPLQRSARVRVVHTEKQLYSALSELPHGPLAEDSVYGLIPNCRGCVIEIQDDITVTKTIDIAHPRFRGLRITSLSRSQLWPSEAMHQQPLFRVGNRAEDVQIDLVSPMGSATRYFSAVVEIHSLFSRFALTDLLWAAESLVSGGLIQTFDMQICKNRRDISAGPPTTEGITARIDRGIIEGNSNLGNITLGISLRTVIRGNPQPGNIVLNNNSRWCVIANNTDPGDITTSGSAGGNSIDGNTACGVITRHATDSLGLNT